MIIWQTSVTDGTPTSVLQSPSTVQRRAITEFNPRWLHRRRQTTTTTITRRSSVVPERGALNSSAWWLQSQCHDDLFDTSLHPYIYSLQYTLHQSALAHTLSAQVNYYTHLIPMHWRKINIFRIAFTEMCKLKVMQDLNFRILAQKCFSGLW